MAQATVVSNRAMPDTGPNQPVAHLSTGLPVAAIEDGGNIYVYLSNAARTTWTLIATVPVNGYAGEGVQYSIAVDSSDNIHVAYARLATAAPVRYRRITATTWALGTDEAAWAGAANIVPGRLHVDILDSAVVVVGFISVDTANNSQGTVRVAVRHTGNAWVQTATAASYLDAAPTPVNNYHSHAMFTLARDAAGASGGTQKIVFGYQTGGSEPYTYFYSTTVTLATGAISALTLVTSFFHTFSTFARLLLFSSAANQWTVLGSAVSVFGVSLYAMRMSSTAVTVPLSTLEVSTTPVYQRNQTGAQYLGNNKGFVGVAQYDSNVSQFKIKSTIATFGASAVTWGAIFDYGTLVVGATPRLWGGSNRNFASTSVDLLSTNESYDPDGTKVDFHKSHANGIATPSSHTPASGSTITTDIPNLGLVYSSSLVALTQGRHKAQWLIAADAGFATSLKTITEPDADFQGGSWPTFGEVVPTAQQLDQRLWYIKGAMLDEFGYMTAYTTATTFTVSHPPTSASHSPTGDQTVDWGAAGSITFDWEFSDPSPVDAQTAYQIVVEKVSDGSTVVDSGKVVSATSQGAVTVPAANKDLALRWKVRLWDSDDVAGAYSPVQLFKTSDKPTVVVTAPAEGGSVNNPAPTATWTFTASAGRTQVQRRVTYYKAGVLVHDSGWLTTAATSYTPSGTIYSNGDSGTVIVEVVDSVGLGNSDTNAFTVSYVAPAAPKTLLNVTGYGSSGLVEIEWTRNFLSPAAATGEGLATGAGTGGNWNISGNGQSATVSTPIKSGTRAFSAQRTTTGNSDLSLVTPSNLQPAVEPGKTYTLAAWMAMSVTTRSVRATILWVGPGSAVVGTSVPITVINTYSLVSVTGVAPAGATAAQLILTGLNMANGELVYIDDVVFGLGSTASDILVGADAEFAAWRLYRRPVGTTAWTLLATNTAPYGAAPEFSDYLASSGTAYEYAVVQVATRFGVQIESAYVPVSGTPTSEDYWLIHPTIPAKNVRLHAVTADSFAEEYETETLNLIGRGRKRDYGTRWGHQGSLRANLYDISGGQTARAQRLALEALRAERATVYLRTPFGDVWQVNMGDVTFERTAGVGQREFGALTIPYQEAVS